MEALYLDCAGHRLQLMRVSLGGNSYHHPETPMPPRIRLLFSSFAAVWLFISAVPLYRELSRRSDIWWTPQTMLVPLAKSQDRVQVFVRGTPLQTILEAGELRIAEGGQSSTVAPTEVGVRFNNWDRVRAQSLPGVAVSAAGCAAAALLLLFIATGRLAYRPERPPVAA